MRLPPKRVHQRPRLLVGLLLRLAAELDDQPGVASREHRAARRRHPLVVHVREHAAVDALERDRLVRVAERDVIAGGEDVGEPEDDERSARRAVHQPQLGLQHGDTRVLGADERAGDVEAVLGQQLVQRVARHETRDVREPLPNLIARTGRGSACSRE